MTVPSAYLIMEQNLNELLLSSVYPVNNTGDMTQPWGALVLVIIVLDSTSLILVYYALRVKKLKIHFKK